MLQCDTFFDALIRAGRRVTIVAVADSSLEKIFRGRDLDYFVEPYDPEVTARVRDLLELGAHDLIVAYQQQYDDVMHKTTPESIEALHALKSHIDAFGLLAAAFSRHWGNYDRAILWLTDHGTHLDPSTGRGTHGDDVPADIRKRSSQQCQSPIHGFALSGSFSKVRSPIPLTCRRAAPFIPGAHTPRRFVELRRHSSK